MHLLFFPIITTLFYAACKYFAPVKMADRPVPVVEKRLMEVKLGELGKWLGGRDLTPNGLFSSLGKGRDRYLNKYIHVKKGGIGGIAMVLTGYVILSYVWSFDHIKHDRWRKYH
ncbi:ATP synthase F(0) complex subunit f, mitochondrial [Cottoperca gobio]|uniref:ATP synthase F(0) complex subunit f, mitochondrial n=1 Tax=Cottoperca gobio TaxID=56716 RepID=A0A6J2QAQ9_COTGO|nr:ATP synthase subunit f, mitochondrial [Cottoperca gobio]